MIEFITILVLAVGLLAIALLWRQRFLLRRQVEEKTDALHQAELLKAQLETELNSLKEGQAREAMNAKLIGEQFRDSFQALAAQALEGNNKQFLELAKSTLEKSSQKAEHDLEKRQTSIESLLKPLKMSLESYQHNVNEIEKNRVKTYSALEAEIRQMLDCTNVLSRQTAALKDALKKPNVRGRWGELQLKNCIELAGMSEYADVNFQDTTNSEEGRLIPDMTVKMPGGHIVVVDAKTPIDAFLKSLESETEEEQRAEMLRHGRHVKEHVKRLSQRAYSDSLAESADFTVMFLPNESFLYAALEVDPQLVEFALQKKILIATPPTLIGLLKVIRYGWNEEKLAENAQKISEAGVELHKRVCDFMSAYENIGKSIDRAKSEFEVGYSRLNSRVLVQARRLETLGAKSNKSLPEGSGLVEESADGSDGTARLSEAGDTSSGINTLESADSEIGNSEAESKLDRKAQSITNGPGLEVEPKIGPEAVPDVGSEMNLQTSKASQASTPSKVTKKVRRSKKTKSKKNVGPSSAEVGSPS